MIANPTPSAGAEGQRSDVTPGIEQRGLVLAQAQCGRADLAVAAIDSARSLLGLQDGELVTTQGSVRFWRVLLAQPVMRAEGQRDPGNPFSQLGPGPRAAVLLRLVAGLELAQAADALQVSDATYEHALDRALATLRASNTQESALQHVRQSLARAVSAAQVPARAEPAGDAMDATPTGNAQRLRPVLKASLGILLLAFVASFFWVPGFLRHGGASRGGFQALHADAPAATLSDIQSVLSGDDFDLLADPKGERIAHDLDLYAWYAAGSNLPAQTAAASPPLPEASVAENTASEADAEEPATGSNAAGDTATPATRPNPVSTAAKTSPAGASHGR